MTRSGPATGRGQVESTARLAGRTAIITGAARGMGEAIARLFVAEGAQVAVADIDDGLGRAVAESLGSQALYRHLDIGRADEWAVVVRDVLERWGRVDVLVNNAAVVGPGSLRETTPEQFRRLIEVNQVGTFLGMQAVVEPMITAGAGAIVNVASIAGLRATADVFAYSATKWAVRGMSQSAAIELAPLGVRVNTIVPGFILTPIHENSPAEIVDKSIRATPLGRGGDPGEVARAALYLASEDSAFTVAAELVVDGGLTSRYL